MSARVLVIGGILYTLMEIDSLTGNCLKDGFYRVICLMRRSIFELTKDLSKDKLEPSVEPLPAETSLFTIVELIGLFLSIMILSKYKDICANNRIEELQHQSKRVLQDINDVLERWRSKKVSNEYSYLFGEQDEMPMTFEIPILHRAFLEPLTPRTMERGDGVDVTALDPKVITSLLDYDITDVYEMEPKISEGFDVAS